MNDNRADEKMLRDLAARYTGEAGELYHKELASLEEGADSPELSVLDAKVREAVACEKLRLSDMRRRIVKWGSIAASLFVITAVSVGYLLITGFWSRADYGARVALGTAQTAPAAPAAGAPPAAEAAEGEEVLADEAYDADSWGFFGGYTWSIADEVVGAYRETQRRGDGWVSSTAPSAFMVYLEPPEGWTLVSAEHGDDFAAFIFRDADGLAVDVMVDLPEYEYDFPDFSPADINGVTAYLNVGDEENVLIYLYGGRRFKLTTSGDFYILFVLARYWLS